MTLERAIRFGIRATFMAFLYPSGVEETSILEFVSAREQAPYAVVESRIYRHPIRASAPGGGGA